MNSADSISAGCYIPVVDRFEGTFEGKFTPEIRIAFRKHRLQLGISVGMLSEYLRVSCSTITKWEKGVISKCHPRQVSRIYNFLTGKKDESILRIQGTEITPRTPPQMPENIQQQLQRLNAMILLLHNSPTLAEHISRHISFAIDSGLTELQKLCLG